ncbi:MAG TPA: hypothetical protein VF815_02645 [Myxococcaceae bacterium]|jgi:hypothetical protein
MKRKLTRMTAHAIQPGTLLPWTGGLLAMWLGLAVGCGPMVPQEELEPSSLRSQHQEVKALNGLSVNGLSVNGLSVNGLSVNGLSSVEFKSWFNLNPAEHAEVMKYVAQCALPAGKALTYINPKTDKTYKWPGLLNLAPDWSSGTRPSLREQQVVSACLAAHINKFGRNVPLSVLGKNAKDAPLPYTSEELALFSEKEACFFGNYFTGQGALAGIDRELLDHKKSSSRACGLRSNRKNNEECPSVLHVGACQSFCTLDATGTYYTQCQYQGQTFTPLTTRIQPTEIFECGDGVCQFTERCGSGTTPDNCLADCGPCP